MSPCDVMLAIQHPKLLHNAKSVDFASTIQKYLECALPAVARRWEELSFLSDTLETPASESAGIVELLPI